MVNSEIQIICKTCNRQAKASAFILDPDFKRMVCPSCVKDKRSKLEKDKKDKDKFVKELENISNKPLGWDKDDEILEKTYKKPKEENILTFQSAGHNKAKYKCPKCSYPFIYDIAMNKPSICPYCSGPIRKFVVKE